MVTAQTPESLREELADVLEVLRALAHVSGIPFEDVERARIQKHQEKGGFDQGIYCTSIEVDADCPYLSYYVGNSQKYPEIRKEDSMHNQIGDGVYEEVVYKAPSKFPSKALVIGKLQPETLERYQGLIHYCPELGMHQLLEWQKALALYKPSVIIFGSNVVTADMLQIWRDEMPHEPLFLLRRGITLARCDLDKAKQLNVQVLNTPHANTRFVAAFICDHAFRGKVPQAATILGVGNIGGLVVHHFAQKGIPLYVFSRKLQDATTQVQALGGLKLDMYPNLSPISTIREGFERSDCIVITLPFTPETKGLVTAFDIAAIPQGARFISTSFPGILTDDALKALYGRQDIDVIFDHLTREFQELYTLLGTRDLRPNFILEEKAATTKECQQAMDEAVINLFLKVAP